MGAKSLWEAFVSKSILFTVSVLALAGAAQAQTAPAGPQPRARGPSLALSVEAAQTAVATCLANGYKVSALVFDSGGAPVVILSGDGVGARTVDIATTKAAIVLKYKVASSVIVDRAKTDAALAAELKADPKIGTARAGSVPIMAGGDFIGAIAVSGAPGGDKDQVCAQAGLDKIAARLK
jgi:uncharacterized protein GlcG (DUF336 family)